MHTQVPVKEFFPTNVTNVKKDGDRCILTTDNRVILRIHVITDNILRFRFATDGYFEKDFSYALSKDFIGGYSKFELKEEADFVTITTGKLICRIEKNGMKVKILDFENLVLCEDEKGFHWEEHPKFGGNVIQMSKQVQESEHYFGLGDKPTHLNLRGKRFQNWGTDCYGYAKDEDPLYKNIPFYIGVHHKTAYGIFLDNSFRTFFDFASERRHVTSFWADGGEMNYYFIYGPTPIEVTERYTRMTGVPRMPPKWALGYHQSKWSYHPDKQVLEIARKFRDLQIPCDAIYLDIDYMDGFRVFTWDKERFPDPAGLVRELDEMGFKTVVIIDPGVKIDDDYHVYREAFEKGYFCKRADGPLMKGKVWPGDCYFPDFTNPEVRQWWGGLYKEMIEETGVAGVWNDMNEPAVFEVESKTFPPDVRHNYDGNYCSHRKAHNVYGMQMARATYKGVRQSSFKSRPFIITRSAYSGAQRYTATWTGDNVASWEHLNVANIQCQRMAVSGFSFVGSDIGGFTEHPSSELYIRWLQLGVFHPLCRTHSSGDHGNQEPWSFNDEATAIVRNFINLRYQLLDYIYSTFWQYVDNGTPMLRPISFTYSDDENTYYRQDEFMLGDCLLVCPVLESGASGRFLYFPEGDWFQLFTGKKMSGGKELWEKVTLDFIPVYVKGGSVLPMCPTMQFVGEKPVEELELRIYYKNGEASSVFYEDAGDGYDHRKGGYSLKHFKLLGNGNRMTLIQVKTGKFDPPYDSYDIRLYGLPFEIDDIKVDNVPVDIESLEKDKQGAFSLKVKAAFSELQLKSLSTHNGTK